MHFLPAVCLLAATVSQVVLASPLPAALSPAEIASKNLNYATQYGQAVSGRDTCISNAQGSSEIIDGCLKAFHSIGIYIETERKKINPPGSEQHSLAVSRLQFHADGLDDLK